MDNEKLAEIIKEAEMHLTHLKQQYRNRESQNTSIKFPAAAARNVPASIGMETSTNQKLSTLLFEFLNQIKGQLDEQSQTLLKINSSVQKLEAENSVYKQKLMVAHSNILQLSSLLENERKKSYLSLERHLIQMQEMLCTELKKTSHEIHELKHKITKRVISASYQPRCYPDLTSDTFQQSRKFSESANYLSIKNELYDQFPKLYRNVTQRPASIAATNLQSPRSNIQKKKTKPRTCNSAPNSQTLVSEPKIASPVESYQKSLGSFDKKTDEDEDDDDADDDISKSCGNCSEVSCNSSCKDLDYSPRQTNSKISSHSSCKDFDYSPKHTISKVSSNSSCKDFEYSLKQINSKISSHSSCKDFDYTPKQTISKASSHSSCIDFDYSPNQTISSTQNLTLQTEDEEEDLHSDDSNFDLLDSRSIGKSEDDLESSSTEDLMSECESYCSEKLS